MKYAPYIIIAVVVLIAVLPWFQEGLPATDDFRHHITKFWSIHESGSEWVPYIYSGWPLTHFYHSLPYYVSYAFAFLEPKAMLKFSIVLSFLLAAWSMYFAAEKLAKNRIIAVTAAIFYTYLPMHFEYAYISGSVSRLWSYAIIPIAIAYFFEMLDDKRKIVPFVLSFSALILSNLNQAYTLVPALIIILLLNFSVQRTKYAVISAVIALLLVGFWAVPLITESGESSASKNVVFGNAPSNTDYDAIFTRNFGVKEGVHYFYAGFVLLLLALFSLFLKYQYKREFIVCAVAGLFFATNAWLLVVFPFSEMFLFTAYFVNDALFFVCLIAAIAVYALSKMQYGRAIVIVAVAFFVVDVYPAVNTYSWVATDEQFINPPELVSAFKWVGSQPGQFRVYSIVGETPYIWHKKFEIGTEWMGYREGALKPIRKITDEIEKQYRQNPLDGNVNNILKYMGVKFVVAPCGIPMNVSYSSGQYCVYSHDALPLVFAPSEIVQGDFEYGNIDVSKVYVKECGSVCGNNRNVEITNIDFGKDIVFSAKSEGAYVVVSSAYLEKHFTAYVDGKKTGIVAAWPKYMLIYVPEGNHEVRIVYGTHASHVIFGIVSLAMLVALIYYYWKSRPVLMSNS